MRPSSCWLPTTMSSRCFSWCPLLTPWKSKITKTKSEVSNEYQIRWSKLLNNYLRQDPLENEPMIVSTTKECTTVEDRVTETNFKAAVRGLNIIYAISLTHIIMICVQELPEIELVAIASATKESTPVEDRVMDTISNAAVRGLIHTLEIPASSLTHIWFQKLSDNPREVIPTTSQYIMAAGKQTLVGLQSAAAFIPVPLIREAVEVALRIIEVCEVRKISPRKGCKMVNNILLPEYIRRQSKGKRAER